MTADDELQAKEFRRRLRVGRAVTRARWLGLAVLGGFGLLAGAGLVAAGQTEALLDHIRLPLVLFALYVLANGCVQLFQARLASRIDVHGFQIIPDVLLVTAVVFDLRCGGDRRSSFPADA